MSRKSCSYTDLKAVLGGGVTVVYYIFLLENNIGVSLLVVLISVEAVQNPKCGLIIQELWL